MDQIGEEAKSRRPWLRAQPVIDGEEGEELARPVVGVAIQGVGERDGCRLRWSHATHPLGFSLLNGLWHGATPCDSPAPTTVKTPAAGPEPFVSHARPSTSTSRATSSICTSTRSSGRGSWATTSPNGTGLGPRGALPLPGRSAADPRGP